MMDTVPHISSTAATKPPKQATFSCGICASSFVRREHLNRHIRTHTKEKPFQCPTCQKVFTRADILRRHEQAHVVQEAEREKNPKSRNSFRACIPCASSRVRCSGGACCHGCEKKGVACKYPSASQGSKSRSISSSSAPETETEAQSNTPGRPYQVAEDASVNTSINCENISGSPIVASLDIDSVSAHHGINIQPAAASDTQWNSGWTNQPTYLQRNHGGNRGPDSLLEFNFQQEDSNQVRDSINWLYPSNEVWRGWDYRFASLADPAVPCVFAPFYDTPPLDAGLNLDLDAGQWEQSVQMDFVQAGAVAANVNSPSLRSATESTHSSGGPNSSITVSKESMPPSARSYIDSVGARGTLQRPQRKRKRSNVEDENSQSHYSGSDDTLSARLALEDELWHVTPWVSADLYGETLRNIQLLEQRSLGQPDPASFPSSVLVNKLCQLYFDHFHVGFPFLQKVPFQPKNEVWILVIATAALGAQYTTCTELAGLKDFLVQILQQGLEAIIHGNLSSNKVSTVTFAGTAACDNLIIIQARILSSIVMIHSGNLSSMEKALSNFRALVTDAVRMRLLQPTGTQGQALNKSSATEIQLRLRAGYMIWMLDFIYSCEFNQRPYLDVADAQAPLPCSMEIWDNFLFQEEKISGTRYTLSKALETLYSEKHLVDELSEFSCILLVQAVCRQTMEVRRHARNRMALWTPSARSQPGTNFQDTELWPPSSQYFSRWRNSACDCLDILHWSANSKIAQSAGLEHPTVLYLHLARLIILTPTDAIREFATACDLGTRFDPQKNRAAYVVLQWAIRDQYKARLSVVHAGAIFWYIRRYSRDLFIEPFAVYMSTLVLWAFSITAQICQSQEIREQYEHTSDEDEDFDLEFINIDRPCDDESVQIFVKRGHKLRANMLRVGSVRDEGAPRKILIEGIRVLGGVQREGVYTWGITREYMEELNRVIDASKTSGNGG